MGLLAVRGRMVFGWEIAWKVGSPSRGARKTMRGKPVAL